MTFWKEKKEEKEMKNKHIYYLEEKKKVFLRQVSKQHHGLKFFKLHFIFYKVSINLHAFSLH